MKALIAVLMMLLALAISPVMAQDANEHRIAFDNFSFTLNSELAQNVNITQVQHNAPDTFPP